MKHKSFYDEYTKITTKEIKELHKCLESLGGSFSWEDNEHLDYPIITVGKNSTGWVGDVSVDKIWTNENGIICLAGTAKDDGFDLEFRLDEIHYSHIEFIMDYLPEVPKDMHGKLIKVGAKVKWQDPAIEDYEPEDRKWVLNRIFVVDKIDYCDDNDPQVYLSEVDGNSEAEAWAHEVKLVLVKEE